MANTCMQSNLNKIRRPGLMLKTFAVYLLSIIPLAGFASEPKQGPAKLEFASDPINTGNIIELVLGLVVVIVLIVLLTWIMRRVGTMNPQISGSMRVLGALSVGTRERVVLLKIGEEQVLVGVAPGRVQALHVLDNPIQSAPDEQQNKNYFAFKMCLVLLLELSAYSFNSPHTA